MSSERRRPSSAHHSSFDIDHRLTGDRVTSSRRRETHPPGRSVCPFSLKPRDFLGPDRIVPRRPVCRLYETKRRTTVAALLETESSWTAERLRFHRRNGWLWRWRGRGNYRSTKYVSMIYLSLITCETVLFKTNDKPRKKLISFICLSQYKHTCMLRCTVLSVIRSSPSYNIIFIGTHRHRSIILIRMLLLFYSLKTHWRRFRRKYIIQL